MAANARYVVHNQTRKANPHPVLSLHVIRRRDDAHTHTAHADAEESMFATTTVATTPAMSTCCGVHQPKNMHFTATPHTHTQAALVDSAFGSVAQRPPSVYYRIATKN